MLWRGRKITKFSELFQEGVRCGGKYDIEEKKGESKISVYDKHVCL